jgi:thiol-disulfide isomerase/thioredoxin
VNLYRLMACFAPVMALAFASAMGATPGDVLSSHTLTTLDGAEQNLSAFRGEVVVVNFWASWCAPCRKELPEMNRWNEAWSGRGARVVAISIDKDARNAQQFVEKAGLSMPVFHDGPDGLARMLDLPSVPCTYLLDRGGRVMAVVRSSAKHDLEDLQRRVESMLSTQKAGVAPTPGGTP